MSQPFDLRELASLLRQLRKRRKISLNTFGPKAVLSAGQLAKLTGVSRRARLDIITL